MRTEYKVTLGAAIFLLTITIIYWFWSREQTGTACLLFSTGAYGLIAAFVYLQWRRRHRIPRPEDREDADMADGAGEVGFFPAASLWPPAIGLGAVILALGMIFGTWFWALGGVMVLGAIIGWIVEAEAREEGPDDPGMPIDPAETGRPATSEDVPSAYRHD